MVERARPLLGTFVSVRAISASDEAEHRAIDAAFDEIALIHSLMSFHENESDVSRLNREAAERAIEVHPHTYAVLELASTMMEASAGCFDITVGPALVRAGALPAPGAVFPPEGGSGRDIELLTDSRVHFRRPLWIDLGGIAKGYAVDRAAEALRAHGVERGVINAGGDLRAIGEGPEHVRLRPTFASFDHMPVLEIEDASLASSEASLAHRDGRQRERSTVPRFVSVVAQSCALADALTKPVIARGAASASLLCRFGAVAFMHEPGGQWTRLGEVPC